MTLRRAGVDEAEPIARLHVLTREVCLPYLPRTDDLPAVVDYFATEVLPKAEVWVSGAAGDLRAFIAFTPAWVEQLYVHPEHQGRGLGDALLGKAKAGSRDLQLWTFQGNAQARRFYEARGFVVEEETDGSKNMEREPDVRYRWRA